MNTGFGSGWEERGIFYVAGIVGVVSSGKSNNLYMGSSSASRSMLVKEAFQ